MGMATPTYEFFAEMCFLASRQDKDGIALACAYCTWHGGEDLTHAAINSDLYDEASRPLLRRLAAMPRQGSADYEELLAAVENIMRKELFNRPVETDDILRMVCYCGASAP